MQFYLFVKYLIFEDQKGKLTKLGLYDLTQETGLAINEAAVQLLASRTSRTSTFDTVTYYGMSFVSESPEYYPLECALLSQMMFFTGDEPLYFLEDSVCIHVLQ